MSKRRRKYAWISLSRGSFEVADVARMLGVVRALATQDYSDNQIARAVGISRATAMRYRRACDEILRLATTIEEVALSVDGADIADGVPAARPAVFPRKRKPRYRQAKPWPAPSS